MRSGLCQPENAARQISRRTVVMPSPLDSPTSTENLAAIRTQIAPVLFQADGDPLFIGDELAAEPHGIGRAGLLGVGHGLRRRRPGGQRNGEADNSRTSRKYPHTKVSLGSGGYGLSL
jgi:hypothetical protein